ncbi:hypothetical protein CEXT_260111 [Caerostris extrusa]|uniref:Uncharacterized protein n=1 Tax=Caerostris extrusa TaxID=172846 RepID=A0AAV4VQZ2_CAEEX|nr:hypothetical protein CEXT_260111 [Caerostris extrusa]
MAAKVRVDDKISRGFVSDLGTAAEPLFLEVKTYSYATPSPLSHNARATANISGRQTRGIECTVPINQFLSKIGELFPTHWRDGKDISPRVNGPADCTTMAARHNKGKSQLNITAMIPR